MAIQAILMAEGQQYGGPFSVASPPGLGDLIRAPDASTWRIMAITWVVTYGDEAVLEIYARRKW